MLGFCQNRFFGQKFDFSNSVLFAYLCHCNVDFSAKNSRNFLKNNRIPDWKVDDAWSSSSTKSFCWGLWKFLLGFADFLDCVCAMPYLQNSKTTSIFQSWNDYLCLKVSLKGLKSYSKHRSIRGHQQSFLIRFCVFHSVWKSLKKIFWVLISYTLFEKSNFCPKNQFWQNPIIFTSFSPIIFFDNFSREIKVVNS